jgi:uncharacterized membrane protein YoaK (UPF0700 family)
MRTYENPQRLLAIGLASLAGFVDALGFLELGGVFVSFMSGNSTRLAVDVSQAYRGASSVAELIAAFVIGVMTGTSISMATGRWRRQAVLIFVMLVLTAASLCGMFVDTMTAATVLMAIAMGAANAVLQRDGEIPVGVTYMTGALVKFAHQLVIALTGGPRYGWAPYLLLWLGLVGGAIAGGAAFPALGLQALWIAVVFTILLLCGTFAMGPLPNRPLERGPSPS